MSAAGLATALFLAATALLAMQRTRRQLGTWRSARIGLQPLTALLLYLLLNPPAVPLPADTLRVLTAEAAVSPWRRLLWPRPEVALPDGPSNAAIEQAPDLATALRRHPSTAQLAIEGDGLALRDQAVARTLPLRFDAAPAHGLLALEHPREVQVGTHWQLEGRAAPPAARVELRDPSGAVVDAAATQNGRFRLSGAARALGPLRFELRVLGPQQQLIETASVPLDVQGGAALTVIVRAGTPDPEFKYWRRWATDAGIRVRMAAGLAPGVDVRDGDASLTPQALAEADLLIIDERAWGRLSADEVAAVRDAVQRGLGLLLRCSGVPEAGVARDWAEFGWRVQADTGSATVAGGASSASSAGSAGSASSAGAAGGANRTGGDSRAGGQGGAGEASEPHGAGDSTGAGDRDARRGHSVGLDRRTGLRSNATANDTAERIEFTAAPVRADATDATDAEPLLRSDAGEVLAAVRELGEGRVGVWRLQDSYRLQLAGEPTRYASLWSEVLAQLARPRAPPRPPSQRLAESWVGERIALCALDPSAGMLPPDGQARVQLDVNATTRCAGYWPAQAGWHRLQTAASAVATPFYVRARDDGAGLRAARNRAATQRLADRPQPGAAPRASTEGALPRWPFFVAWLAAMGWLMGLERRSQA